MSSIVYQHDKRSGTTYAYRSTSYRDPSTGRPRSRREYLGRVDPETGEIVPKAAKGRRNRSRLGGEEAAEQSRAARALEEAEEVRRLRAGLSDLRERYERLESAVGDMLGAVAAVAAAGDALGDAMGPGGVIDEEAEG
jgi:hypothetical protein